MALHQGSLVWPCPSWLDRPAQQRTAPVNSTPRQAGLDSAAVCNLASSSSSSSSSGTSSEAGVSGADLSNDGVSAAAEAECDAGMISNSKAAYGPTAMTNMQIENSSGHARQIKRPAAGSSVGKTGNPGGGSSSSEESESCSNGSSSEDVSSSSSESDSSSSSGSDAPAKGGNQLFAQLDAVFAGAGKAKFGSTPFAALDVLKKGTSVQQREEEGGVSPQHREVRRVVDTLRQQQRVDPNAVKTRPNQASGKTAYTSHVRNKPAAGTKSAQRVPKRVQEMTATEASCVENTHAAMPTEWLQMEEKGNPLYCQRRVLHTRQGRVLLNALPLPRPLCCLMPVSANPCLICPAPCLLHSTLRQSLVKMPSKHFSMLLRLHRLAYLHTLRLCSTARAHLSTACMCQTTHTFHSAAFCGCFNSLAFVTRLLLPAAGSREQQRQDLWGFLVHLKATDQLMLVVDCCSAKCLAWIQKHPVFSHMQQQSNR